MKRAILLPIFLLFVNNSAVATNIPSWDVVKIKFPPISVEEIYSGWRFVIFNINQSGQADSPLYYGETDKTGMARVGLPLDMLSRPLVVEAYTHYDLPFLSDDILNGNVDLIPEKTAEIFIPSKCEPGMIWHADKEGKKLWQHFKKLIKEGSWNPSLADCSTWHQFINYLARP